MYRFVYGLLYLLSLLPLRILYLMSTGFYVLVFYVFGYRRTVVQQNLRMAFPEKPDNEIKKIEKQFYKNFIDNFIETLKLLSGGSAFADAHFHLDNALLELEFKKGHRLQVHMGHNFNWELANIGVTGMISYPMLVVYMPIQNKIFDRVMMKLRTVSGNHLLPATDMRRAMIPFRGKQYLLALVADQVPGDPSKAYWLNFFGRPTPFLRGPERGAVAGNLSVIFGHLFKTKRGKYEFVYELCTSEAATMPKGEITRRYVRFLEKSIRRNPEMWLWSHRRWKKEWKPEYSNLWIDNDPHP